MTFKIDFLSLMTKVSLNNGNDTKSDIFPWDIFKSDSISFFSSKYIKLKQRNKIKHFFKGHIQIWHHIFFYQNILKYFNDFQNQNVNPKNKNEAKSDIFPWDIFKSETFFYQNILKYFKDFQNRNFSLLWLK